MALILPTQLFEKYLEAKIYYLYEHPLHFTKFNYHKNKLVLHRASMKKYEKMLKDNGHKVVYVDFDKPIEYIFKEHDQIEMYDSVDHDIRKEFNSYAKKHKCILKIHDSPMFLNTIDDYQKYLKTNPFLHRSFYIYQRKKLKLFIEDGKPIGGKWSFDNENRKPFPDNFAIDFEFKKNEDKYVAEAIKYVEKHFKDNFGEITFFLPIDHKGAKNQFKEFLKKKLKHFGPYQDAFGANTFSGAHSLLSPLLNIGLITPEYIVEKLRKLKYDASLEGFLRQIIGWREYMRMFYELKYDPSANHFRHHGKLDKSWYTGTTGIEPIDVTIRKVIKYGYAHHIERLMVLSSPMLLLEISPKEVYNWFMMFIDSYPWVMAGNVYAMGQYATGNLITKRPYFSASNYILKMSKFKRGKWADFWDKLFYKFIRKHKKEFSKIYSLAGIVKKID